MALAARSDFLFVTLAASAATRHIVDGRVIAALGPQGMLINISRAANVDEAALLAALCSGQVGSAGLDSFAVEPMTAPHPFHGEPRITLSPHIGGVTADAYVKMGVGAARNALAVLNG